MLKTKTIFSLLIFSTILLLGLYVFQVEEVTKMNYIISQSKLKIEAASKNQLSLQDELGNIVSLDNVEQKAKDLGFVKVNNMRYMTIPPALLARRTK